MAYLDKTGLDRFWAGLKTWVKKRENLGLGACADYNILPVAKGGTGKMTAAEALKNLGGISLTKLWENASPTSAFAAQTITKTLTAGAILRFEWKPSTTGGERIFTDGVVGGDMLWNFLAKGNASAVVEIRTREVNITTAGITFAEGYAKSITNPTTYVNNSVNIPLAIYLVSGYEGVV